MATACKHACRLGVTTLLGNCKALNICSCISSSIIALVICRSSCGPLLHRALHRVAYIFRPEQARPCSRGGRLVTISTQVYRENKQETRCECSRCAWRTSAAMTFRTVPEVKRYWPGTTQSGVGRLQLSEKSQNKQARPKQPHRGAVAVSCVQDTQGVSFGTITGVARGKAAGCCKGKGCRAKVLQLARL